MDTFDVDTFALDAQTVIHDRERNRDVMRLNGILTLPAGAEIELTDPNVSATVTGIRLAGHGFHMASTVILDVTVPEEWWAAREQHT